MTHYPQDPQCKHCNHSKTFHFASGEMNSVTEPEHHPSKPHCEMCYIDRTSKDSMGFSHEFEAKEAS